MTPPRQRLADFEDALRSREFADVLGPATTWWYRRCAAVIRRAAPSARRVLDVGTGPGHLLPELARRYPGTDIVGLDRSCSMLQIARTTCASIPVLLVQGSFEHLPFRNGSFDLVCATGVLHHAEDPAGLFREVRRVLIPGGRFVALAFRRDAPPLTRAICRLHSWLLRRCGSLLEGGLGVLRASWTGREIEACLAQSGFSRYRVQAGAATLRVTATA